MAIVTNELIDVQKLTPFKKFVMSIGQIPTSYLESMSYAELLMWFCNYLQNTVIPTVNNNGEAVEELQNAFIAFAQAVNDEIERFETGITTDFNNLEDFVNNYFDNNFPELVKNTLDEMAEDGTLENLLNDAAHLTKSYNTYNEMMADSATFTNGLRLKTYGYYNINDGGEAEYYVNNSVISTNYQIELENGLYLNLIVDDIVNVKKFGAKSNGIDSCYTAFSNAINYCKNSGKNDLYVPEGKYLIDDYIVIDFPLNIKGSYAQYEQNYESTAQIGSIIIDDYDGSEPLFKYENLTPDTRIWGVKIENIEFCGQNNGQTQHTALYLHKTGWEGCIKSVRIQNYNGTGLFLDRVFDTEISNVSLIRCGSWDNPITPKYAMVLTDSSGEDTTNALHIFGLHIEICRYALNMDRARNNEFVGSKFENRILNENENDTTNPEILITGNSRDNTFNDCSFNLITINKHVEKGMTISDIPYSIQIKNTSNQSHITKFTSCTFNSSDLTGIKAIDLHEGEAKIMLSNCVFFTLAPKTMALNLINGFIDNTIFITWNTESLSELKNITFGNCLINNIYVRVFKDQPITTAYGYVSSGRNRITNANFVNYNSDFYSTYRTDIPFKEPHVTLDNATYLSLMGLTNETVDWTNLTLDLSRIKFSSISFNLSQDATIKTITNGQYGEQLNILNIAGHSLTIGGGSADFDYQGNKIRPNGSNQPNVINGFGSVTLVQFQNYLKVMSVG